jgi:hypothetical protein
MNISFREFVMDKSVVAPVIYDDKQHYTTNMGVSLAKEVGQELSRLLSEFNLFVGVEKTPYYRLDAYFDANTLWILEINASFVDGWGTALNLARAAGICIDSPTLKFPKKFVTKSRLYYPELKLLVDELSLLGIKDCQICEYGNIPKGEPVYVYGRAGSKDEPYVFPYDGVRLDNKMNLALFSRQWESDLVKLPRHYAQRFELWEQMPKEVAIKFCDKGSVECRGAFQSVIFGKPSGKAPSLKRWYREEKMLAQEMVQPEKHGRDNCQLIVLAIGNQPITGYTQYSWAQIINDASTHGPLMIS